MRPSIRAGGQWWTLIAGTSTVLGYLFLCSSGGAVDTTPLPPPVQIPVQETPAPDGSFDPSIGAPTDGPEAIEGTRFQFENRLRAGQFVDVDRVIDRYAALRDRFDDGRFKLSAVHAMFAGLATSSASNAPADQIIKAWRAANPRSAGAAIAHATFWRNYAWAARGSGFADSVTPQGWELFQERLKSARTILEQTRKFASQNPLWYEEALEVSLGLGDGWDRQMTIYEEGIHRFPSYFPLHFHMLRALQPRWGGSEQQAAEFVAQVLSATPPGGRAALYTRLWWYVAQVSTPPSDIFTDYGARWADMQAGFETLAAQWPTSPWIFSSYAYFACRSGDMTTYAVLGKKLGFRLMPNAFSKNYPIDVCDRRAGPAT